MSIRSVGLVTALYGPFHWKSTMGSKKLGELTSNELGLTVRIRAVKEQVFENKFLGL